MRSISSGPVSAGEKPCRAVLSWSLTLITFCRRIMQITNQLVSEPYVDESHGSASPVL
jgi:hypothetical protein